MFKVLIAEDEMLVRVGLKNAIEWDKFGMTVIADVPNGQEAWEVYQRDAPDIVITDIKMPVMDGMELIGRIRETDQTTKVVILTCMEDFELVRKALVHQVSEYILKLEMTPDQIEKLLGRLQRDMNAAVPPRHPVPQHLESEHDAVKENLIKDYLFCNGYTEREFAAKVDYLRLNLKPTRMIVCAMEIDQYGRLRNRFQDQKGQLTRRSLLNVLNEVLRGYERGEAFHDEESRYAMIFSFHDLLSEQQIYENLYKIIDHIRKVMATYFNVTVSFGISDIRTGYSALIRQYRQSIQALERKFFDGPGKNAFVAHTDNERIGAERREKLLGLAEGWEVGDGYGKLLAEKIQAFLSAGSALSKQDVQKQFMQWLLWPISTLHLARTNRIEFFTTYADRIMNAETLDEMIEDYRQYLAELARLHAQKRTVGREINSVLRFIEANYERDITLEELAELVQMSPNYLSGLFKKEMQQNYADYLVQYRIEQAKELLLGTYMKTYEVAEKTGFANHSYFSRAFKKMTGSSPREFRRQWMVDWSKAGEPDDQE
ncbi:response regulator transcription factor [Cohnella cellulosilytica]|uniref:Response regulator n=1 Tax=Cohnella cellulosilytica TaxID=986710 RepID=A0ABW2FH02_9BACL